VMPITLGKDNMEESNPWRQSVAAAAFCFMLLLLTSLTLLAAEPASEEAGPYKDLEKSFQRVLDIEREKHESLAAGLESAKAFEAEIGQSLDNDLLQISTYRNQLFVPSISINELRDVLRDISAVSGRLAQNIRDAEERLASVRRKRGEALELMSLYEKQQGITREQEVPSASRRRLDDLLNGIMKQLRDNEKRIDAIEAIYSEQIVRLREMQAEFAGLAGRVTKKIDEETVQAVFHRDVSPVFRFDRGEWEKAAASARDNLSRLFSADSRPEAAERRWRSFLSEALTVLIILGIMAAGLLYLGRHCGRLRADCHPEMQFWQRVILTLIQRSLPIAAAILFFHIYLIHMEYRLPALHFFSPLLIRLLSLWLVVQWGLILIRTVRREIMDAAFDGAMQSLKRLLQGILAFGILHALVEWIICQNCIALISLRLMGEIAFFVWTVLFVRAIGHHLPLHGTEAHPWIESIRSLLVLSVYVIASAGLVFELAGYGGLAALWYFSWGKTAVVLFWAFLFFRALREFETGGAGWKTETEEPNDAAAGIDAAGKGPDPVRWAVIRLARLMLTILVLICLPMAWGAEKTFPADLFEVLNYRIRFGDVEINTMGFIYALLVLFVVNIISVIWQGLLRNKVFSQTTMEEGLKQSISRISTYILWIIGILMALRIMGISSTSLAVIFGALGIGIGFGLQNIVGNFISGIILLFERPMQVGDVIEVGGTWGIVKEINVRSTHLKTYDNSDLMVPNSDFISQRVINWSFRDPKVRRTVTVGVAYGSDIARVKEILLDIANTNSRVYRQPAPDALFADFGDSALIFKLRVWVHIEYLLSVESDIRFEIDKRFREANITIPFPQRDLYIKEVRGSGANEPVIGNAGKTPVQA
jgi:potassium-dependent mechanosensitive channel